MVEGWGDEMVNFGHVLGVHCKHLDLGFSAGHPGMAFKPCSLPEQSTE